MPKWLAGILAGAIMASAVATAAEGLPVAVDIKPVHSLVAAVMEGAGVPYLVVGGTASPHDYALRPSDAKALEGARLVFRVGGGMGRFLDKPLTALAADARVVELAKVPFIGLLATGNQSDGRGNDYHLWLDPRNARAIVAVAVAELSALDPANAGLYRDNGERMSRLLDDLVLELKLLLDPVVSVPFVVYHDAFRYLVDAFGLNQAGFVAIDPERPPGTQHVRDIRLLMRELGVRCLFREPQFGSRLMTILAEERETRFGVLDPLGAALEPGPDLYFRLMRTNAAALAMCLGGG